MSNFTEFSHLAPANQQALSRVSSPAESGTCASRGLPLPGLRIYAKKERSSSLLSSSLYPIITFFPDFSRLEVSKVRAIPRALDTLTRIVSAVSLTLTEILPLAES